MKKLEVGPSTARGGGGAQYSSHRWSRGMNFGGGPSMMNQFTMYMYMYMHADLNQ